MYCSVPKGKENVIKMKLDFSSLPVHWCSYCSTVQMSYTVGWKPAVIISCSVEHLGDGYKSLAEDTSLFKQHVMEAVERKALFRMLTHLDSILFSVATSRQSSSTPSPITEHM